MRDPLSFSSQTLKAFCVLLFQNFLDEAPDTIDCLSRADQKQDRDLQEVPEETEFPRSDMDWEIAVHSPISGGGAERTGTQTASADTKGVGMQGPAALCHL